MGRQKNVMSLAGGHTILKSRDEEHLWCIDCQGILCVVIVPSIAYQKVDAETTVYSETHSMIATIGCTGINTRTPILVSAVCPLTKADQLSVVVDAVHNREVPSNLRNVAADIFADVLFIESEDVTPSGVVLKRVGNQLEKGEYFTQLPSGERVEIYHTCLLQDEPKPYSAKEMATLKFKGLFWPK